MRGYLAWHLLYYALSITITSGQHAWGVGNWWAKKAKLETWLTEHVCSQVMALATYSSSSCTSSSLACCSCKAWWRWDGLGSQALTRVAQPCGFSGYSAKTVVTIHPHWVQDHHMHTLQGLKSCVIWAHIGHIIVWTMQRKFV